MLLSRQFRLAAISLSSERQQRGRGGRGKGVEGGAEVVNGRRSLKVA